MGVSLDSHPGSKAFDVIGDALKNDPQGAKDAIKKGGAVFAFTLSNAEGKQESWYIDLKRDGVVGKGTNPEGMKADVTILASDTDFAKLAAGTANAQNLFMSGKIKIRGDIMKAAKLGPVLQTAQTKAKL